jgi:PAS domain S-box-containing protein
MNSPRKRPRAVGITLRTALWSWVVTLVTLAVFAVVIIPQQRRIFLENLESKARGVAVSLRDVAASSIVNGDYDNVVDHCNQMLEGDPALDFLVVVKNDGTSALFFERQRWSAEAEAGPEWRPGRREASGGLTVVPRFDRRVFRFSQPFDYSGIEWGWIHVGLSLDSYDRSVASVYQRTLVLAAVCMLFGLIGSVFYARRLVRPILTLRNVVQRVAGGDLAARAEVDRGDELGTLAGSVNTMTEALLRRDRILQSVRFAAQRFLRITDWTSVVEEVLARIGEAAAVSRIRIFENQGNFDGSMEARRRFEWVTDVLRGNSARSAGGVVNIPASVFRDWASRLQRGEAVAAHFSDFDEAQQRLLERDGFKSALAIPINVETSWWGTLTLVDCQTEREWTDAEQDSFRAAADMLGAAIVRQRAQDGLIEAKETLEVRVRERTQELVEQVQAKEEALAERQRAEATLAESEERFRGLFENATLGIYRTSTDGQLLLANPALLNMMRFPSLEAANQSNLVATGYVLAEERARFQSLITRDGQVMGLESQWRRFDGSIVHVRESARVVHDADGRVRWYEGTVEDITEKKAAEAELARLNQELRSAARQAGRAEIATSVLHNVGNVLNSVSVSATIVSDRLRQSRLTNLRRAAALLTSQGGNLAHFLTHDPKGKILPDYLDSAAEELVAERAAVLAETAQLAENIEHIKKIVAMQQNYAKAVGVHEQVVPTDLVEDAIRMNAASFQRHRIEIVREFDEGVPRVIVDRHRVLEILINLLRNAKHALEATDRHDKQVVVTVRQTPEGRVAIRVRDNGVGIAPENLTRIFRHGFTTKKDGHGFGLHSGAIAAREMGGSLGAHSDGSGHGAEFTLEIPVQRHTSASAS